MKKIGTIDCGCAENCGRRIKLYWRDKKIVAKDPHGGEEIIEQHYSRKRIAQAIEDIIAMYDNDIWHLELN